MDDLKGEAIAARDGLIGSLRDVYFDDAGWAVRYLVVDTGDWLSGRKVLLSPASVPPQESGGDYIRVDLTREQVKSAPGTEADPPVSRVLEEALARHYGYEGYWTGIYLGGPAVLPYPLRGVDTPPQEREIRAMAEQRARESHLRSGGEVVGYRIRAVDGEVGHVEDFVVDDDSWAIAVMVVDTRNWLPGRKVLVRPQDIEDIDWDNREVRVRLRREELKRAPEAS